MSFVRRVFLVKLRFKMGYHGCLIELCDIGDDNGELV